MTTRPGPQSVDVVAERRELGERAAEPVRQRLDAAMVRPARPGVTHTGEGHVGDQARPLMQGRNAALLTLTYLGSERFVPMYNVMGAAKASLEANVRYMAGELGPEGIRVNGISAGPIKTLAGAGIKGFRSMLAHAEKGSALRRNVTIEEVGNTAAFLCSDLASGITGEIIYVDAGFRFMGFTLESMGGQS